MPRAGRGSTSAVGPSSRAGGSAADAAGSTTIDGWLALDAGAAAVISVGAGADAGEPDPCETVRSHTAGATPITSSDAIARAASNLRRVRSRAPPAAGASRTRSVPGERSAGGSCGMVSTETTAAIPRSLAHASSKGHTVRTTSSSSRPAACA